MTMVLKISKKWNLMPSLHTGRIWKHFSNLYCHYLDQFSTFDISNLLNNPTIHLAWRTRTDHYGTVIL